MNSSVRQTHLLEEQTRLVRGFGITWRIANGKKIVLMSDGCVGQNKNSIVSAVLMYSMEVLNIPEIEHAFFEKGHSFMECDSVHSSIETGTKKK